MAWGVIPSIPTSAYLNTMVQSSVEGTKFSEEGVTSHVQDGLYFGNDHDFWKLSFQRMIGLLLR